MLVWLANSIRYGRDSICWLTTDGDRLIFAFVGPVAVVLLCNLYFFFRAIYVVANLAVRRRSTQEVGTCDVNVKIGFVCL
jgi:hypothetical protein